MRSKLALTAAAAVLVASACAGPPVEQAAPATGSNRQDMLDLNALKRDLFALRAASHDTAPSAAPRRS